jgi:predicted metal-binding protein
LKKLEISGILKQYCFKEHCFGQRTVVLESKKENFPEKAEYRKMVDERIQSEIEQKLLELPVVQYAWLPVGEVEYSDKVRSICRTECPRYGKSWSCPPGVGTIEQCRRICESYEGAFVFTTIAEVLDITNMEETLATRGGHEGVTRKIQEIFREQGLQTLALSGESCAICEKCAYPDAPCRHPDRMIPCIEGYGIVVPLLAEKAGIEFENVSNVVTWFGMILF